jgi:hypothetical protein
VTGGRCGSRQCGADDHEGHEQHGCRPTTRHSLRLFRCPVGPCSSGRGQNVVGVGATSSQKFGDWSSTNFSRRHSGGGHWDGVSFERKNIQTSQPLRTSLCQPGLGDVIFGRHSGGGPLERLSWSMGCKPRNPCEHSLCQPRLGVGPASCSFLSERESEAGSSETTHFARGPCENHPCRYSCLCVSGGTKFRDTGR